MIGWWWASAHRHRLCKAPTIWRVQVRELQNQLHIERTNAQEKAAALDKIQDNFKSLFGADFGVPAAPEPAPETSVADAEPVTETATTSQETASEKSESWFKGPVQPTSGMAEGAAEQDVDPAPEPEVDNFEGSAVVHVDLSLVRQLEGNVPTELWAAAATIQAHCRMVTAMRTMHTEKHASSVLGR